MLTKDQRAQCLAQLRESRASTAPGPQFSQSFPEIEIADSYAISAALADSRVTEEGRRIIGHKIGLTSRVMQQAAGVTEPDYGYLFDDGLFSSGVSLERSAYNKPRVEPELAFLLHSPLQGPGLGIADVLRATEWVIPALEIVDARVQDPRKITDTIADNAAGAGIVLGGRPMRPEAIDLTRIGAVLHRNAAIEETGLSAAVLGHPAQAVAWLANTLGREGTALQPGDYILSGSFTRPVAAEAGETLLADFGPLGTVAVHFS